MIYNERNIRKEIVLEAAKQIMMAARTAPKGKGVDIIEIITLSPSDSIGKYAQRREKTRHDVFSARCR